MQRKDVFLGLKVDADFAAKIDNALERRRASADPVAISKSSFLRHLIEAGLFLLAEDEPAAPTEAAPPVAVVVEERPEVPPPMAIPVEPAALVTAPSSARYPGLKEAQP